MSRPALAVLSRAPRRGGALHPATAIVIGVALVACGQASRPSVTSSPVPTAVPEDPTSPPTAPPATTAAPALGAFPPLPSEALADDVGARLQAIVGQALADLQVPGIAAAVISGGKGTWVGAAGTADGEAPLDPAAELGVGSVTKTVLAAEVLRLVEVGEVELDRPIAEYLPDPDIPTNGATVRQVLGMRSGIGEVTADPHTYCDADLAATVAMSDLIPALSDEVLFEPGARFQHTNANWLLAGLMIENVTGTSVARALRVGVLATPSLARLVYQDEERPTPPLAAPFVVLPGSGPVPGSRELLQIGGGYLPGRCLAAMAGPAGGMSSDEMTLARWGYLLYGGWILGDATLAEMTDTVDGYGLAAHDQSSRIGVAAIGHEGTVPGYVTSLLAFPQDGLAIAVLVNTNDAYENDLVEISGRLRAALTQ